ncbi:MAG TPA: histidine kinase [Ideonella sp.]|nr:histidine kinase [Ideonella sp.]
MSLHAPLPLPLAGHPLLQRLLVTQGLCLAIAAMLALAGSHFWLAWLYSICIGTSCWALIDGSRQAVARLQLRRAGPHAAALREGWPGWLWMTPLIVFGGMLGFLLGSLLADQLTGLSTALPWRTGWRGWVAVMAMSVAATVAATGYFYASSRIASAEAEVAQVGRLAAETQLKLLESQLEPHMLFNTLANLRALIGVDPARAQAMLDQLIDFLRATLSASRATLHPLSAEFARLADYLALMQIRMGDRLQVELALPPALAAVPVPPLLLQPLVENAIKHGLEPQRAGGVIRISARQAGASLVLEVLNTGRGLAAPTRPAEPPDAASGFGLAQVRERLATLYGERASFTLAAGPDGLGSTATVRLPLDAPV